MRLRKESTCARAPTVKWGGISGTIIKGQKIRRMNHFRIASVTEHYPGGSRKCAPGGLITFPWKLSVCQLKVKNKLCYLLWNWLQNGEQWKTTSKLKFRLVSRILKVSFSSHSCFVFLSLLFIIFTVVSLLPIFSVFFY